MCVYCAGSRPSFHFASSDGSIGENFGHRDDANSETDTSSHELSPSQATLPSIPALFCLPLEGDITSTQNAYEESVNSDYMGQPPDHVVDYWFHRLGLCLDTPLAGTPEDLLNLPSLLSV